MQLPFWAGRGQRLGGWKDWWKALSETVSVCFRASARELEGRAFQATRIWDPRLPSQASSPFTIINISEKKRPAQGRNQDGPLGPLVSLLSGPSSPSAVGSLQRFSRMLLRKQGLGDVIPEELPQWHGGGGSVCVFVCTVFVNFCLFVLWFPFLFIKRDLSLSFFSFWPCFTACGILVPRPGIELVPPALEVWNLNHWNSRESLYIYCLLNHLRHKHYQKFSKILKPPKCLLIGEWIYILLSIHTEDIAQK